MEKSPRFVYNINIDPYVQVPGNTTGRRPFKQDTGIPGNSPKASVLQILVDGGMEKPADVIPLLEIILEQVRAGKCCVQ